MVRSNVEGVRSTTSSEDEYSPKDEGTAAAIVITIIKEVNLILIAENASKVCALRLRGSEAQPP